MRAPIHSVKHYVQISRSTVLTGARNIESIIVATNVVSANLVDEVVEGAVVKAVYFELWVIGSTADQHGVVIVSKEISGQSGPSFAEITALGNYDNKKNVLFTHQGLASNDGIAQPIAVLRHWIKIPKSKQRFGLGDRLALTISSAGDGSQHYCGFATYKEYR